MKTARPLRYYQQITKEDEERFWKKVDCTTTPTGCWPFTGYQDRKDYGRIDINRRPVGAHRVAWILTHGPIPLPWLVVMHTCDNPPCCNQEHLELKEPDENVKDRDQKGRQARGERHGLAKLQNGYTDADEIRALYAAGGISQRALARRFNVHQTTIGKILRGDTWHGQP